MPDSHSKNGIKNSTGERTCRFLVTTEEATIIERSALSYGMSKSEYIRACACERGGRLSIIPQGVARNQALVTWFRGEDFDRATANAARASLRPFAEFLRQRALGGLKRQAPRRLGMQPGRGPGRPRKGEYLIGAAGGDMLRALTLDTGAMRDFVEGVFELGARAGVRPGDVAAVAVVRWPC